MSNAACIAISVAATIALIAAANRIAFGRKVLGS